MDISTHFIRSFQRNDLIKNTSSKDRTRDAISRAQLLTTSQYQGVSDCASMSNIILRSFKVVDHVIREDMDKNKILDRGMDGWIAYQVYEVIGDDLKNNNTFSP